MEDFTLAVCTDFNLREIYFVWTSGIKTDLGSADLDLSGYFYSAEDATKREEMIFDHLSVLLVCYFSSISCHGINFFPMKDTRAYKTIPSTVS